MPIVDPLVGSHQQDPLQYVSQPMGSVGLIPQLKKKEEPLDAHLLACPPVTVVVSLTKTYHKRLQVK